MFGRKRKGQPIDAALTATQEAAHYDPDAYLTVSGFGLPLWAFSFEKEVEGRARKYAQQVNPDEYNGDYLDAFLTARADQLRRSLDLQLANKTFTIQERARARPPGSSGHRPPCPRPSRNWPAARRSWHGCASWTAAHCNGRRHFP